jgi:hypothetical protein
MYFLLLIFHSLIHFLQTLLAYELDSECAMCILQGFASAFHAHDSSTVNTLAENFDYKSIMMYDEYAFSKVSIFYRAS